MSRSALGIHGEELAARYLAAKGYVVLARNWSVKFAELDLVAQERGEIVFVEVKTRRGDDYGNPEDAVDERKRRHLRNAAHAYLRAHAPRDARFRIDVIAITVRAGAKTKLAHFKGAVGESAEIVGVRGRNRA